MNLDYHQRLWCSDCGASTLSYLVGAEYSQLGQQFDAHFFPGISASASTGLEFDGFGIRFGLDGRRTVFGGFFVSAMANANLMGGQFEGQYLESFGGNNPVAAETSWHEARFVTMFETGVSVGWQSPDGRIRTSLGYVVNDWMNVVKPSDFISAVQANHYVGPDQVGNTSLVFDGLTARFEFAW